VSENLHTRLFRKCSMQKKSLAMHLLIDRLASRRCYRAQLTAAACTMLPFTIHPRCALLACCRSLKAALSSRGRSKRCSPDRSVVGLASNLA
jgi:hypothetical protein